MKKRKNRVKYYGITARVVAFFTALVIVPYLCLAIITYIVFQNYSISSLGQTTMDTMAVAAANIHSAMNAMEENTMAVYYNNCVELLGKGKMLSTQEEAQINNVLSAISYSNTGVLAAYLESEQGIFHSGGNYSDVLTIMEPYKDEIVNAGGKCMWHASNELFGKAKEYNYILARSLNSSSEGNVGILYLVLSDKMIQDALGYLSAEYADWYLTDEDGRIYYSSGVPQAGDTLDVSMLSTGKKSSYQMIKDNNKQKNVISAYCLMDAKWFCISKINIKMVQANVQKLVYPFVVISGIYIIFLFVMLYIMRRYIFQPLRALKNSMDQYALDELSETRIEIYGIGEFHSLSSHFNNMTFRISKLMESYKNETDEKNRQKMKALAAQLTPHFVYNALNTIKWVAVLNQQNKIQSLVESLISIFMNAARSDDEDYTLKDELDLINHYAVIQKARFMNFELVIDAEPLSLDCRIRKLLVQPIVENAIVHGLNRGKIRNGIVIVKTWIDDSLHITVTDKGRGFDVEMWRNSPNVNAEHTNIGIHNVEEIIRLEYGKDYGLIIESVPGQGTDVIYNLPVIREEEKRDSDNNS